MKEEFEKILNDKDKEIEQRDKFIIVLKDLLNSFMEQDEKASNYKKAFEHMKLISQEHLDKLDKIAQLYNSKGYVSDKWLLDEIQSILKE